mmetsp:Transcript_9587/g.16949  ORF Transcript_9587/g.16949 Transcript_9587/m.16949 type:complete len:135 (+) Transcript_9587:22-426(+)
MCLHSPKNIKLTLLQTLFANFIAIWTCWKLKRNRGWTIVNTPLVFGRTCSAITKTCRRHTKKLDAIKPANHTKKHCACCCSALVPVSYYGGICADHLKNSRKIVFEMKAPCKHMAVTVMLSLIFIVLPMIRNFE